MNLTINPTKTYQTFEGFGASGAWWAQSVGARPDLCDQIARLLYDRETGIGLSIYRYNLGAGSADSGAGNCGDALRRTHSLEAADGGCDPARDAAAVNMMRKAADYGAREIVIFSNSPPERMTKNGKAHLDEKNAFRTNLAKENYGAFASYMLDAAERFLAEGLPVKYISPVNEPIWKWTGGQEGCHYSPLQARRLLRVCAEGIEARPALRGKVLLSGMESGDLRWFNKSFTRALLSDKVIRRNVDAVDYHSYFLPLPAPPFMNDRIAFMKRFRGFMDRHYPDVPLKMSEWCHMRGGRDAGMDSALVTARVIIEDLTVMNVTAWSHWIACSHYDYCDGLIYFDPEKDDYTLTKRYFVTGNFSKFIPLGALRIETDTGDEEVLSVGFAHDGGTTVILSNESEDPKFFFAPADLALYTTDKENDLAGRKVKKGEAVKLPPRSVTTLKS